MNRTVESFQTLALVMGIFAQVVGIILRGSIGVLALAVFVNNVWPSARVVRVILSASALRLWQVFGRWWFQLLVIIALVTHFLLKSRTGIGIQVLVPETKAFTIANIAGVAIFHVWLLSTVNKMAGLLRIGVTLHLERHGRLVLMAMFLAWYVLACPPALVAAYRPGPDAVWALLTSFATVLVSGYLLVMLVAIHRRSNAPIARDDFCSDPSLVPDVLILSDVHVTEQHSGRAEGGASGNDCLRYLNEMPKSETEPRYLLVTGDLVDRGIEAEYRIAIDLLDQLRKRGMRVLLAPGNHDLGTAYDPRVAQTFLRDTPGALDLRKLMQFLLEASKLEPELRSYSGNYLAEE